MTTCPLGYAGAAAILTSQGARLFVDGCSSVVNRGIWSDVKLPRGIATVWSDRFIVIVRCSAEDLRVKQRQVSDGPAMIDISPAFNAEWCDLNQLSCLVKLSTEVGSAASALYDMSGAPAGSHGVPVVKPRSGVAFQGIGVRSPSRPTGKGQYLLPTGS